MSLDARSSDVRGGRGIRSLCSCQSYKGMPQTTSRAGGNARAHPQCVYPR